VVVAKDLTVLLRS